MSPTLEELRRELKAAYASATPDSGDQKRAVMERAAHREKRGLLRLGGRGSHSRRMQVVAWVGGIAALILLLSFTVPGVVDHSKPSGQSLPRLPQRWRYVSYDGVDLGVPGGWAQVHIPQSCHGSTGLFITAPNSRPLDGFPSDCVEGADGQIYVFLSRGPAFGAAPFVKETVNGLKVLVSTSKPSAINGQYTEIVVVISNQVAIDIDTGSSLGLATEILHTLHKS